MKEAAGERRCAGMSSSLLVGDLAVLRNLSVDGFRFGLSTPRYPASLGRFHHREEGLN